MTNTGDHAPWEQPRREGPGTRAPIAAVAPSTTSSEKGPLQNPLVLAGIGSGLVLLLVIILVASSGGDTNIENGPAQPGANPSAPPEMHQRAGESEHATQEMNEFRAMFEAIIPMIQSAHAGMNTTPTTLTGHPRNGGCNVPETLLRGKFLQFEDKVFQMGLAEMWSGKQFGIKARSLRPSDKLVWRCTFGLTHNQVKYSASEP